MTGKNDARLEGRHPEFARMSLRPGIGHDAVYEVASVHLEYDLTKKHDDVITQLRHGTTLLPLGRYLTRKLRKHVGMEEGAPASTRAKMVAKLSILSDMADEITKAPGMKRHRNSTIKGLLEEANRGKHIQLEHREKRKRKTGI